jgi:glycosyltransferase involved in cell wall biosynthesis
LFQVRSTANTKKGRQLSVKVYWDGYGLERQASGIYVYAQSLATQLAMLGVVPEVVATNPLKLQNTTFLAKKKSLLPSLLAESKLVAPLRTKAAILSRLHRSAAVDPVVLHGLSNINLPLVCIDSKKVKTVLTVHDIIPLLAKNATSFAYRQQFAMLLPLAARRADRIVCVSDWTRQSLLNLLPDLEKKTVVIKNGRSGTVFGAGFDLEEKPKSSNKICMISVLRSEKYKRVGLFLDILRAFKGQATGILLTDEKGVAATKTLGSDLPLEVFCNVVDQKKQSLYRRADVYVHPSLYEGFCLPVVEALESNLPVVYQSGSAVGELVSSKVAVGLPGKSKIADWCEGIEKATELAGTVQFADDLRSHLENMPTWKDAAIALKNLYTEVIQSG